MSEEKTSHPALLATPKQVREIVASFQKNPDMKTKERARLFSVDNETIKDIKQRLDNKQRVF